jgi:hypothetical protein
MMKDLLLREFADETERPLARRLAKVFDEHLGAEQDAQVEQLKRELEQALAERLNEAAEG